MDFDSFHLVTHGSGECSREIGSFLSPVWAPPIEAGGPLHSPQMHGSRHIFLWHRATPPCHTCNVLRCTFCLVFCTVAASLKTFASNSQAWLTSLTVWTWKWMVWQTIFLAKWNNISPLPGFPWNSRGPIFPSKTLPKLGEIGTRVRSRWNLTRPIVVSL